ncbi:dimethyladenosine transferase [Corynebacterium accolens ATCC 49726]|uniref:16S rRNA (adenine(1518)-N(6)/adenine(1519)-N(6))- dimethyltransferase RsmA n=1 Tax=Corynebacterium accolens TaxID=38284 RepID=UPI0001E16F75|nr:16S rRNA (adenine(1518)-N(6)/adenine(1519)-N(6))-dimethyltransferase RsmA [Corynebacterium accolens]EFM44052.1 dimethyladenosine transferase [Corynebacterium accolens ATCC 49726]
MTDSPGAALLGPVEIRALAEKLDITPTKKLGQNFLHDPNTIRRIIAAADLDPADRVVEVGPGLGSLTLGLVETVEDLTAVEIDPRLAAQLPETVGERAADYAERLRVVEKDALRVTSEDVTAPTALVANLPYNVAVPVLLHFLETFPSIRRVLVMVQLEVAQRLAAAPGSKIYGVPSVKAGFYGTVSQAGTIGKNVFWPAPNIASGLVRIDVFDTPPWPVDDAARAAVWPLVDAAFAQRRKTLRAALSGHYGSGAAAEEALRAAGIDPQQRGEKLAVADFVRLAGLK